MFHPFLTPSIEVRADLSTAAGPNPASCCPLRRLGNASSVGKASVGKAPVRARRPRAAMDPACKAIAVQLSHAQDKPIPPCLPCLCTPLYPVESLHTAVLQFFMDEPLPTLHLAAVHGCTRALQQVSYALSLSNIALNRSRVHDPHAHYLAVEFSFYHTHRERRRFD